MVDGVTTTCQMLSSPSLSPPALADGRVALYITGAAVAAVAAITMLVAGTTAVKLVGKWPVNTTEGDMLYINACGCGVAEMIGFVK